MGVIVVDASAKFLRVAHEKYKDDPRFAARLLRFIKEEKRLQSLDEVLGPEMLERGVEAIVAANAIHLYPDLDEVAQAWVRALKPGGRVFINSGNLRNPRAKPGEWILDETVWVINDLAESLVRSDPRYAAYRDVLDDDERMQAHHAHRDRVFLQPRPLSYYTEALTRNGLTVTDVDQATIVADVDEWFELMTAYHEAVLGWVGGTRRVEGSGAERGGGAGPAGDHAPRDRHDLRRARHVQGVLDVHHRREGGVMTKATPLEGLLREHGACIAVRHGMRVAAHFGSVATETAVCRRSVGLADRFGRRVTLDVRGPQDSLDTLLERIPGVRLAAQHALLRCEHDDTLGLDDDLLAADVTGEHVALALVGPRAGNVLALARLAAAPFKAIVLNDPDGYEILVPRRSGEQAWLHLLQSGRPLGLACVGFDALEHLAVARHHRPVASSSPNVAMTTPASRSIQPRLRR